jgi:hypothetical protein
VVRLISLGEEYILRSFKTAPPSSSNIIGFFPSIVFATKFFFELLTYGYSMKYCNRTGLISSGLWSSSSPAAGRPTVAAVVNCGRSHRGTNDTHRGCGGGSGGIPSGGCLWNWRRPLRFWLPLQRHFRRRGGGVHLKWVPPTTRPPDPAPKPRNPPSSAGPGEGDSNGAGTGGTHPTLAEHTGSADFCAEMGGREVPGDVNKI